MRLAYRRDAWAYMEGERREKDGTSGHGISVYSPDTHTIPLFHSPLKKDESAGEEVPMKDEAVLKCPVVGDHQFRWGQNHLMMRYFYTKRSACQKCHECKRRAEKCPLGDNMQMSVGDDKIVPHPFHIKDDNKQ